VAMTDVTGFGLGGHLLEICENSFVNAELNFSQVPLVTDLNIYINQKCIPGGSKKNFNSYGNKISAMDEFKKLIICDPQTSGGLLIITENEAEFLAKASEYKIYAVKIGQTKERFKNSEEPYIEIL
jgi:selenide,water dikinase